MLPDIGGSELLIIAAVALIVVGPKDLPVLMRKIGQFIGKMRGMANEFRASFDEMARQSELDELRKEVEAMRSGQYTQPFKEAAEAARDVGLDETFAQIDASLKDGTVQASPAAAAPLPPEPAAFIEPPPARPAKPRGAPKAKAPAAEAVAETVVKAPAAKSQAAKPKAVTAKTAPAKASKPAGKAAPASPAKRASSKRSDEITVTPAKKSRAAAKKSDIIS